MRPLTVPQPERVMTVWQNNRETGEAAWTWRPRTHRLDRARPLVRVGRDGRAVSRQSQFRRPRTGLPAVGARDRLLLRRPRHARAARPNLRAHEFRRGGPRVAIFSHVLWTSRFGAIRRSSARRASRFRRCVHGRRRDAARPRAAPVRRSRAAPGTDAVDAEAGIRRLRPSSRGAGFWNVLGRLRPASRPTRRRRSSTRCRRSWRASIRRPTRGSRRRSFRCGRISSAVSATCCRCCSAPRRSCSPSRARTWPTCCSRAAGAWTRVRGAPGVGREPRPSGPSDARRESAARIGRRRGRPGARTLDPGRDRGAASARHRARRSHSDRWARGAIACGVTLVAALVAGSRRRCSCRVRRRVGAQGRADAARRGLRGALVVAEIAAALVLALGAGLLVRSFVLIQGVDPGFNRDRRLGGAGVCVAAARYSAQARRLLRAGARARAGAPRRCPRRRRDVDALWRGARDRPRPDRD